MQHNSTNPHFEENDSIIASYNALHNIPIIKLVTDYLNNTTYNENTFLIRISHLDLCDKQRLAQFITNLESALVMEKRCATAQEHTLLGIATLYGSMRHHPNLNKAILHFQRAAAQNVALAYFCLGVIHYSYAEKRDENQARQFFNLAAKFGSARAFAYLGLLVDDRSIASQYYANAAMMQDAHGKYLLAKQQKMSYYLLLESVQLGDQNALFELARQYVKRQRLDTAAHCLYLANKHGNKDAGFILLQLAEQNPQNFFLMTYHLLTNFDEFGTTHAKDKFHHLVQTQQAFFAKCHAPSPLRAVLNILDKKNRAQPLRRWAFVFRGLHTQIPLELIHCILTFVINDTKLAHLLLNEVSDEINARENILKMPWRKPKIKYSQKLIARAHSFFSQPKFDTRQIVIQARFGKISYCEALALINANDHPDPPQLKG